MPFRSGQCAQVLKTRRKITNVCSFGRVRIRPPGCWSPTEDRVRAADGEDQIILYVWKIAMQAWTRRTDSGQTAGRAAPCPAADADVPPIIRHNPRERGCRTSVRHQAKWRCHGLPALACRPAARPSASCRLLPRLYPRDSPIQGVLPGSGHLHDYPNAKS
jgi:hypothetical protein